MSAEEENFEEQKRVFKALNSARRLRLLHMLTEGPVTAPEVEDEFEVTAETIVNNLNHLEDAGFAQSKTVRGPGGRPRKEFRLKGNGVRLEVEAIEDEYFFDFFEVEMP